MICAFLLAAAVALDAEPATPEPADAVAVLPVAVNVDGPDAQQLSLMLTSALTTQLGVWTGWRIISTDEVTALMQNERDRQLVGCNEPGCLAELAGALGARYLLTSDVVRVGADLVWPASLVDQRNATVLRRTSTTASGAQSLLLQSELIAATLVGRQDEVQLSGERGRQRLGFASLHDMAAFEEERQRRGGHPSAAGGAGRGGGVGRAGRWPHSGPHHGLLPG